MIITYLPWILQLLPLTSHLAQLTALKHLGQPESVHGLFQLMFSIPLSPGSKFQIPNHSMKF